MKNNLSIITLKEKEKWNEIVKSFNNYDVFYLPEYVEAFEYHGDGEPLLIYYNDRETRAINVILKRDISNIEKVDCNLGNGMVYMLTDSQHIIDIYNRLMKI